MVLLFEGTDKQYSMDGYLSTVCSQVKIRVRQDWDMMFVIDGTEGAGKSVLAQQMALACDPTFDLTRIVFTPKQFREAVYAAEKHAAIIYDEAYGGLGARGTMSQVNMLLVKMLTEIRYKNLILFVVLPTFFDLDKYVALWRSRGLIHVYAGDDFTRGRFAFYNKDQKKLMFILGKKMYSYAKPRPSFRGTFPNHYTVNEQDYKLKKRTSTANEVDEIRMANLKAAKGIRTAIAQSLQESKLLPTKSAIADILGVTDMTIHRYLKDRNIEDDNEE